MAAENNLDLMVAELRALPGAAKAAAAEVGEAVREVIAENVAAQRGPDGEAWPKSPTGDVLTGAAAKISITTSSGVVILRLSGPEARHHLGIARGKVLRRILPTRKIPAPMVEAIRRVLVKRMKDAVKI